MISGNIPSPFTLMLFTFSVTLQVPEFVPDPRLIEVDAVGSSLPNFFVLNVKTEKNECRFYCCGGLSGFISSSLAYMIYLFDISSHVKDFVLSPRRLEMEIVFFPYQDFSL